MIGQPAGSQVLGGSPAPNNTDLTPDQIIRQAIADALAPVPGTGAVYKYLRIPKLNETKAFLDLFKDPTTNFIMGWEITRAAIQSTVRVTNRIYKVTYEYQLNGYYSVVDAVPMPDGSNAGSELFFGALVDSILQALADMKVPGEQGLHLPKAPVIGHKIFGSYLCHYAEISVPVSMNIELTKEMADAALNMLLTAYLTGGEARDQAQINVAQEE